MEGIVTVIMAVLCFFFLVDSPALSSRWLDPDEIRYLELRQYARHMQDSDQSAKEKTVHWDALWAVMTDWKIYLLILVNWSNAVPNYALKFTMPQTIKNMGYTSATAQLLTIPPYAVGALTAYAFSVFADRYSWRMPFIVGPQLSLVVAFSILFTKSEDIKDNIALCYFAVCLACFGMYPILPGVNAWNVANLAGPQKRSIGIGWLICAGNIGGVIGSYIYVEDEAPRYPTGYGTSFAFASAGILACLVLEFALWTINKRNARFTEEQIRAQYTSEQLHKMGDKSPLYKYSL
ncbi:Major facilitator superfamily [Macrophomina phaseolina MS6]|uniref:Major facilitator superfamily n=1 Tax=Macrophomina phaseolina (strain MS6) TaxID=1126212 RepID=K2S3C6_MACPH|nr:Major facilitator superfamily [Macrophomina phaseolina MS6]